MTQIYLRWQDNDQLDYLIENDHGDTETGSAFHPDQYPIFPKAAKVTLLVPGEGVVLLTVQLPKLSRAQLVKTLPFALEEQIIDEPQDLYFFPGQQESDGYLTVAVVKKTWLRQWIEKCTQLQLIPDTILPDYLALPTIDNGWHVYLDGERALVRQSRLSGFSVELSQLNYLLPLQLKQSLLSMPDIIKIDYDDSNEHFEMEELTDITCPVTLASSHYYCMELFQLGIKQSIGINLLPTDLNLKKTKTPWHWWRWAAYAFCAFSLLWVINQAAQIIILKSRLAKANQQITVLYHQAFPQATAVVEPQLRVQQALANQQMIASGGIFLNGLLRSCSILLKQNIVINEIGFHASALVFNVQASNFQQLTTAVNQLQQQGLQVQQDNANSESSGVVTARLTIKGDNHA